ncbi:helix-turn-helix transcriptional regulator [Brachybacterium sp. YJGR34]|uniref:ArsR/SmtB family transcription factor n=1 Tax=Brachybacterium sp. YJGR34 TaxID=2059911 RepID=UPI000E0BCE15|nr:metalloregulator ArsR/SmtB family transcription factor [Brachybacterium sp. YJGR34]
MSLSSRRPARAQDADAPVHVLGGDEATTAEQSLVEELSALLSQAEGFDELAARMALLSDPRRLRILFCIHALPGVRSSDIARTLGAHDSTTSHALALLRDAGWVRAERAGREVRYVLADGFVHDLLHDLGSDHLPGVHHGERPGTASGDAQLAED